MPEYRFLLTMFAGKPLFGLLDQGRTHGRPPFSKWETIWAVIERRISAWVVIGGPGYLVMFN